MRKEIKTMTKIKLTDGTIIEASTVEVVNGVLQITTKDTTVEKLAKLFKNASNTSLITLMTESGVESGYKQGFTSFAGIMYNPDGSKTVEIFQPRDTTEARIANAEAAAHLANEKIAENASDITNLQLAVVELYESMPVSANEE